MYISNFLAGGSALQLKAGISAINSGDLVSIGGPGNEAYTVATIDYAKVSNLAAILTPTNISSYIPAGTGHQAVCRDGSGNVYAATENSSGNLAINKYSPSGTLLLSAVIDSTVTSVVSPKLFQLSNGTFCCVYATNTLGHINFSIFDSNLVAVLAAQTSVTNAYGTVATTSYHDAIATSGGNFAVVWQTSAGIVGATYSNLGVQATGGTVTTTSGTAAYKCLRLGQLSSGNLVCAYSGAMVINGNAGAGSVIFTTAFANVGYTALSNSAVLTFVDLSILPGYFAMSVVNGSVSLAHVYTNLGAAVGTNYSATNTYNSMVQPQSKLTNDGVNFWFAYIADRKSVV